MSGGGDFACTHRPRRVGETSFGGDIVSTRRERLATGLWGDTANDDGLFRKIMTFIDLEEKHLTPALRR